MKKPKTIKITSKHIDLLEQLLICEDLKAACNLWNGIQLGLVVAQLFLIGEKGFWWVFGIFWIVTAVAFYYMHKRSKALKKLEEL